MKVALVLLFSFVKAGLNFDYEFNGLYNGNSILRYLASDDLTDEIVLNDCLNVKLTVPEKLKFRGSDFLFKLLRAAYLFDLKNEPHDSTKESTVFKLGLASSSSDQCEMSQKDIHQLVIKTFSQSCDVPNKSAAYFKESDIKNIPGYSKTCPQKLNTIVDSIRDRFNEMTSEDQKSLDMYVNALKLVFINFAEEFYKKNARADSYKLRFFLLNEFMIAVLKSSPTGKFSENVSNMQGFVDTKQTILARMFRRTTDSTDERGDELKTAVVLLKFVTLNTDHDTNLEQQKKEAVQGLFETLKIQSQNFVI